MIPSKIHKSSDEAIRNADIIVTATSSSPVFTSPLNPGVHINAVGSFRPSMQELPTSVVLSADKIIVKSLEAVEETGDLKTPIKEGVFDESDIYGELGKVINREIKGRENDQEVTLFKSVGLSIVDIVVANYIYKKGY